MLRVKSFVLVVVLLLLGACGKDDSTTKAGVSPDNTSPPGTLKQGDEVVTIPYSVTIKGEVSLTFDEEAIDVRVMTIRTNDQRMQKIRLLSVGPPKPLIAGGAVPFRVAFDLTGFNGNASYAVRAGSPRELVEAASKAQSGKEVENLDQSNVLVQIWSNGDVQTEPVVYDFVHKPCRLKVEKEGYRGSLKCERVSGSDGKAFQLAMQWG